jgi:hypothetical protein
MIASLVEARSDIARALVEPIRAAVVRRDTGHAAFHGCIDWHSAVHGTWALVAYARMTGDGFCDGLVREVLRPEKLAAERALLNSRPDFEMPYGRGWFLRLAREHALHTRSPDVLGPMAGEVLASMLAYYATRSPDPRRGSYGSDSWALINMLDYATSSGDASAERAVRRLVEAHFLDPAGGCDDALERGHFMAVATNWAWLVGKVLPGSQFQAWRQMFRAVDLPQPVTRPESWHHHGLNFSRAWGLAALAEMGPEDEREAYLAAYAAHFRATYESPALWRGSYRGVGHWVPQFGMLALQPLFGIEIPRPGIGSLGPVSPKRASLGPAIGP